MLPLKQVISITVCSCKHAVEICLCRCFVLRQACQQICSDAGDTHPCDIVIVFVIAVDAFLIPFAFVASDEVRIEVVEHCCILLVACCLKGIEHNLEHLCVAPPAAVAYDPACAGFLVATCFPLLHHIVALVFCEGFFHGLHNFDGPSDASGVVILCGVYDFQLCGDSIALAGKCVSLCCALEDLELIGSAFDGNEVPRAFTAGSTFACLTYKSGGA